MPIIASREFAALAHPHDHVGQPGGNAGNQADQEHGQEHQQQERHDAPDHILEWRQYDGKFELEISITEFYLMAKYDFC
jgi:hypothetical protein